MSFVPTSYTKYSQTADSVVFVHNDHTLDQPHTLTVTRVLPRRSSQGYSNARYNVKIVKGLLDANGAIAGQLTFGTTGISIPVSAVGVDVALATAAADLAACLTHLEFSTACLKQQLPSL